ncbi:MAG: iron-containing alcohol dehydrogenase [Alphaproteobacteria bacterium]|nr:iron-containing alcohol dehydrogenase [Alphaproteobacteria bacterium]
MARIAYLTTIDFDHGAVEKLDEVLTELEAARPLLVTDRGLVESGLAGRVSEAMPKHPPAAVFDATPANPTEQAVCDAAAVYRESGCESIVALGGGSPIDLAKAVALMASHVGPLLQYAVSEGGSERITSAVPPIIAIPTTAGTGSEVGRAALIVMGDGRKLGFISSHLLPRRAICDPDLTLGLPSGLTAATGMDAVAHCIETFLSPAINPPADAIALDGLRRAMANIEIAVGDGGNRDARWQMMMAALQGGLCFQKGLGAVHALSHPLGALRDPVLHHGTLNAVLLPSVLRYNAAAAPEKYEPLRAAMDIASTDDPADAIADLNERIGLPMRLSAMGVPEDVLPAIAEAGMLDHCTQTNPRAPTAAEYATLLHEVY